MFTIKQIEEAHNKMTSGADFPKYIQEIKQLGVTSFETFVKDGHTIYYSDNDYKTISEPLYNSLVIKNESDKKQFINYLKIHQNGETDFFTFCDHCAETGIEKWIMNLDEMTCTYYNIKNNEILVEEIPV
ncbi:Uncharacterized conserved protein YbcV, DUF1398 family [Chishuiella changwenlii]|jgi:uncharacterized protein YbcV (DUF1398 family)|uniref:Uncharacterized conserved protein YbcV, DUF1398 family n=1 Tax=Chishuiella changwenlii TaxID=1434701 RepID=A0A1M7AFL1_9FLAO|nr:DUF1398 family protein [Chishuiella changwenlii]GGE90147.1 hypothetical protein GCM10010984_04780 [Chishuiella changwenlii]SHL41444.1 Uncharacterized conserved protein YbcV, DUF1398 family [Chishuiella changwenlii]